MHIFHSSLGGGKDRRFLSLEYYEHPSRAPALAKPALRSAGSLHPAWVRDGAKGGPRQEWLAAMAAVGQREFGQWGARSQFQPQRRATTAANASAASATPLHYADATELARQIRSGEVRSIDVVEAFLHRIRGDPPRTSERAWEFASAKTDGVLLAAVHNPKLTAVVTVNAESALLRAAEADAATARGESWGPLHGIPFTAKEVFDTAGVRSTRGSKLFATRVPDKDATAVARLKDAGAILLGKTNCARLGPRDRCHDSDGLTVAANRPGICAGGSDCQ